MEENRVIIYSSGVADFLRWYDVQEGEKTSISIPVGSEHLADLLASFNIFGQVRVETPLTFRPSNEMEGRLEIDPSNVLESLSTKLSGSAIEISSAGEKSQGRLIGLHSQQETSSGDPIQVQSVVVLTDSGIRKWPIRDIDELSFLDQDIQQEIDKALKRNFQRITPNSTFVELELTAKGKANQAAVQYTIPAAAWKISYRLNLQEEKVRLQGYAVVDNNTDEDWKDFRVCVVTGQPITFSTDLAESKTPARNRVNLVADSALGAVEIEEGFGRDAEGAVVMAAGPMAHEEMCEDRMMFKRTSASPRAKKLENAEVFEAETDEVGDFCFYQSADLVTVAAKRSAAIPVFDKELDQAKGLLHYDHGNHAVSPYRSIQLKNSLPHSLGKGVCTVYQEGAFAGSCIVPEMKEGQQRLLAHALDSGVKVHKRQDRLRRTLMSLQIDGGIGVRKEIATKKTVYRIKNNHKETFQLILDHDKDLAGSEVTGILTIADQKEVASFDCELKKGWRYRIDLDAKSEMVLEVQEQRVNSSRTELVRLKKDQLNFDTSWIQSNLIQSDGPLANHDNVKQCVDIQSDLSALETRIARTWNESRKFEERQARLRKNIETAGADPVAKKWREDLGDLEDKIREIEDLKIPELHAEKIQVEERLKVALMELSVSWAAEKGSL